ncbi:MAG: ribbon-helix-helix protein, CopG family [Acidobacteria bacterium]|nr:ribbon-helix-helix protein, CopG family [Acidobacteriota bacterium]MBI3658398.1 ribbon-helix-helix protein, CopG family [Acidobacteriota bacterium]
MRKAKIAITLDKNSISRLDHLVHANIFLNRSQAIQEAVDEKIERLERHRLAKECAKLDSAFEKAMAEEGLSEDLSEWPEY